MTTDEPLVAEQSRRSVSQMPARHQGILAGGVDFPRHGTDTASRGSRSINTLYEAVAFCMVVKT